MKLGLFLSGMRIAGLGFRLFLSMFIVTALGVDIFGRFSLLLAITAFVPPMVSVGLHYHTNRAVVGQTPTIMAAWLRDRIALNVLIGGALIVVVLIGLLVFSPFELSGPGLAAFLAICIFEAVLSDTQLYLLSCQKPVLANLMLFSRSALWVPAFTFAAWFFGLQRLEDILFFWFGGCIVATIMMAFGLRHWPWRLVMVSYPSFRWQFMNFSTSSGIWISDISAAIIPFLERSLLLMTLGPTRTGVYAFFWTLANGALQVIVSAIIQPAIPTMIDRVRLDVSGKLLIHFVWQKCREALISASGFGLIILIASYVALPYLGRPEILKYFGVLPLLILGVVVSSVSEIFRLALYVLRRDSDLIQSNLAALALNMVLLVAATTAFGLTIAALVPLTVAANICLFRWSRAQRSVNATSKIDKKMGI